VNKRILRFALLVPRYLAGVEFGDDFQGDCSEQATSAATDTKQNKSKPLLMLRASEQVIAWQDGNSECMSARFGM
jgi:hypothetical protein